MARSWAGHLDCPGQKAERKTLIFNNREFESATKVRREFVETLLTRKTAAKGWQYFTVHAHPPPRNRQRLRRQSRADMIGAKTTEDEKWGRNPLKGKSTRDFPGPPSHACTTSTQLYSADYVRAG